jgi:hypothetical protein
MGGLKPEDLFGVNRVVAPDQRGFPQLANVPRKLVDEGVVVVD